MRIREVETIGTSPRTVLPTLGLMAAAGIIVANMIGQGVFLKGRVMACETATPAIELVAWAIAGAIAFSGAVSFAELAAMMPQAGGPYIYIRRAFGKPAAFLVAWANVLIAAPASIGALAAGGAIFFNTATNGRLAAMPNGTQLFSVGLVVVVTALNCAPARLNGNIAIVSAILKTFTLAAITFAGFAFGSGAFAGGAFASRALKSGALASVVAPHPAVSLAAIACSDVDSALRGGAAGFVAAMLSALYAYNGWIAVTGIAAEIRNPTKTIPRALFLGVVLVAVLYVAANGAFVHALGFANIRMLPTSASVGIASAETLFGPYWGIISAAFLFASVVATLHTVVLYCSRVIYAVACDGMFPLALSRVSSGGVPVFAVIATSVVATVLVLLMGFERLSDWFTFEVWLIFVVAVVGLFVLRRREPNAPRPYRVLGYPFIPAAFLTTATYVLVVTTFTRPLVAGSAIAITLCGLPAYVIVLRFKRTRKTGAPL